MSLSPEASVARLFNVLREVSKALDAGDSVAAAEAMSEAVAVCGQVDLSGPLPSPRDFRELAATYERCLRGAGPLRAKLQAALKEVVTSRRAATAYQGSVRR